MRVLILANTVLMLLFLSCSSSEQPMSLATSDYGTDGAGTFNQIKFNLVRKGEQVNSSYYTSGCSSIKPDGTCQALVTYSGTGEFIGQSIGIVTSPTGRITADTTGCPKIVATKQSCKITLAHVVGNPIHTGVIREPVKKVI